jgi:hypothetical protein
LVYDRSNKHHVGANMTLSIKDHLANAESAGMSYAAYAREQGVSLAAMYKARTTESPNKRRTMMSINGHKDRFLKVTKQKAADPRTTRSEVVIRQMSVGEWSIAASGLSTDIVTRLMAVWTCSGGEE